MEFHGQRRVEFFNVRVDREQKTRWSLCPGRGKPELYIVLEILHFLVFLELRGMKHLHPRVPAQVDDFVTLLRGFKSSAGKRVCQVCAGKETLYQSCAQETINASKDFGVAGNGLVPCPEKSSQSFASCASLGC